MDVSLPVDELVPKSFENQPCSVSQEIVLYLGPRIPVSQAFYCPKTEIQIGGIDDYKLAYHPRLDIKLLTIISGDFAFVVVAKYSQQGLFRYEKQCNTLCSALLHARGIGSKHILPGLPWPDDCGPIGGAPLLEPAKRNSLGPFARR